MKYKQFISELEKLLDEGRNLLDVEELHDNNDFRKWRKRATNRIDTMTNQNYDIHSSITSRAFGRAPSNYIGTHIDDLIKGYKRDLQDTLNEFEIIVDDYK